MSDFPKPIPRPDPLSNAFEPNTAIAEIFGPAAAQIRQQQEQRAQDQSDRDRITQAGIDALQAAFDRADDH